MLTELHAFDYTLYRKWRIFNNDGGHEADENLTAISLINVFIIDGI